MSAQLTPIQWFALLPHVLPRSPAGRPIADLRNRMDGIFHMACGADPWRALPARFGRPDTVSRYFRRLTHAGLWPRLLEALKESGPRHPLWEVAPRIFRACRRAVRLLGLRFVALIRRLGFLDALNGPPCKVPDPHLSETMRHTVRLPPTPASEAQAALYLGILRALRRLHRRAGGIKYIPRALRLAWS